MGRNGAAEKLVDRQKHGQAWCIFGNAILVQYDSKLISATEMNHQYLPLNSANLKTLQSKFNVALEEDLSNFMSGKGPPGQLVSARILPSPSQPPAPRKGWNLPPSVPPPPPPSGLLNQQEEQVEQQEEEDDDPLALLPTTGLEDEEDEDQEDVEPSQEEVASDSAQVHENSESDGKMSALWYELRDGDKVYYWSEKTGSTWEAPEWLDFDDERGCKKYRNTKTGEVALQRPCKFVTICRERQVGNNNPLIGKIQDEEVDTTVTPSSSCLPVSEERVEIQKDDKDSKNYKDPKMKIYMLTFSKNAAEYQESLHNCPELEPLIFFSEQQGYSCTYSYASIFVHPSQFQTVRDELQRMSIFPHQIIVSESYLPLVRHAIEKINMQMDIPIDGLPATTDCFKVDECFSCALPALLKPRHLSKPLWAGD